MLRIWFDGSKSPCVEVPVTDFFGSGFGNRDVRALPLGQTPAGMYCYFKMPFSRETSAELVNLGEERIPYARLQVAVSDRSAAEIAEYPFRFHARWGLQTTKVGEPVNLATVIGPGDFCGTSLGISGNRGISFLEGDEQFTVDAESFPSVYGTGTEDYFNIGVVFCHRAYQHSLRGMRAERRTKQPNLCLSPAYPRRHTVQGEHCGKH